MFSIAMGDNATLQVLQQKAETLLSSNTTELQKFVAFLLHFALQSLPPEYNEQLHIVVQKKDYMGLLRLLVQHDEQNITKIQDYFLSA